MEQTRIFIEVHNATKTSEPLTVIDSDITLGSSKEATVRLPSEIPFLFTFIRYDTHSARFFLQFTNVMTGSVRIDGIDRTFVELRKHSTDTPCVSMLGLWVIVLPPESTGYIMIEETVISFAIKPAATVLTEHAA